MPQRRDQRRIGNALWQFDGKDDVVKPIVRGGISGYGSALCVDYHVIRLHADRAQHGTHQRSFVFAVAIAVSEHIAGGMRLPTANAELNCDVANILLHKFSNGLYLVELS